MDISLVYLGVFESLFLSVRMKMLSFLVFNHEVFFIVEAYNLYLWYSWFYTVIVLQRWEEDHFK